MSTHRRLGRVEQALENEVRGRPDIGQAERAALRVQAHALDLAERVGDPELITTANRGYLDLRQAAGLTVAKAPAAESPFDALLAELAKPGAGASDTANT